MYIKFSPNGSYTCQRYDCVQVELHVENGCPQNLYVEANVTADGAVVGMTNASPGGVGPDSEVKLSLEDIRDIGDGFKLTKVSCY
ncbi:hypothetical protein V2S04_11205 [Microbacterium sp. OR21]|uniref:hypothetical protein n=1 Tax=Microbacterium sp. OR21 TaxID=3095346 RepID=UPI0039B54DCE